jgi:hypothetical protein
MIEPNVGRLALERKGSGMFTTLAKLLKNDTGATAIEYV